MTQSLLFSSNLYFYFFSCFAIRESFFPRKCEKFSLRESLFQQNVAATI